MKYKWLVHIYLNDSKSWNLYKNSLFSAMFFTGRLLLVLSKKIDLKNVSIKVFKNVVKSTNK